MSKHRSKDRTYLILTIGTLLIGGGAIIALVYGPTSLLTALPFLLLGSLLIWILWGIVTAVGSWRERSEREYHEAAARHIAAKQETGDKGNGTDSTGR
jgi:FtsH-binding integral membrane protein